MADQLILKTLQAKVRTTPISRSSSIYAQSLIARGFADTRATKIADAIDKGDMLALAIAIGACDYSYFKWLFDNEPILFLYFKESAPELTADWDMFCERIESILDERDRV